MFRLSAEDLGSIQSPVLLVWGKREEVFTEEHFEWFNTHLCARTQQRTQVFRPDKLGHIPHLDGAMLSGAIAAFLHDSSV